MYPISHYRVGDGKMTRQELENTYIVNEHGTFAPRFELSITKQEIDGEVVIIEDYTITATSEEVYQEYLTPPKLPGDKMEVLEKKVAELEEEKELLNKENKILHAQIEVLSNTTDFHEELITEMAMKVYA